LLHHLNMNTPSNKRLAKGRVIWYATPTEFHILFLSIHIAIIAQSVERIHGKDEVNSSILFDGSNVKNP